MYDLLDREYLTFSKVISVSNLVGEFQFLSVVFILSVNIKFHIIGY